MSMVRTSQRIAALLASATWLLPGPQIMAAPPADPPQAPAIAASPPLIDVAIGKEGQISGQVLDVDGRPFVRQTVVVRPLPGTEQTCLTTDANGRFVVSNPRPGLVQVSAGNTSVVCRCWTSTAAPPAAKHTLLLVSDGSVQRGQKPIGEFFFSNPVLLGLIIAAAIAIPIAVNNSKKSAS